jgi:GNAT superfamily N-acetyltransferase
MIIREAKVNEREELFREAYKFWSRNRTFKQYCEDNSKEDSYGTRYIIEGEGEIVSSMILLRLKELFDCKVYGIGSVLTHSLHTGKGYASRLLKYCLEEIIEENSIVFLYSEINPSFYERLAFRTLPPHLQKDKKAVCMVLCTEPIWEKIIDGPKNGIPDYF